MSQRRSKVQPTIAGSYLFDALDAVRCAGSVDGLYDPDVRSARPFNDGDWVWPLAAQRRMGHSRSALLLAAFAAEAYINEFLEATMSPEAFAVVDRLSTPEKYVIGPPAVLGKELLRRGHNPLQSLRDLFVLRNRLAHPRTAPDLALVDQPDGLHPVLNPLTAMRHIAQVSKAANIVITEGGRRTFDRHAGVVIAAERDLMRYARRATSQMVRPDEEDSDEREAVFVAAVRFAEVALPQFRGYYLPPKRRRSA